MKEHIIKIKKTARYYSLGDSSASVKHVWFCLHGYGQLGKYFIHNFKTLENSERLIIAPEAPNRFYLQGTGGRVGATWMTKEERLRDIDDYCVYLNNLSDQIISNLNKNVKIHVFGFSQGVATAFRWVNNYKGKPLNSLHAWAGTFPPDIDYRLNQDKFNALDISLSFSSDDQFISQENANVLAEQLEQMEIKATRFDFEGEHKIYALPLKALFDRTESKI